MATPKTIIQTLTDYVPRAFITRITSSLPGDHIVQHDTCYLLQAAQLQRIYQKKHKHPDNLSHLVEGLQRSSKIFSENNIKSWISR